MITGLGRFTKAAGCYLCFVYLSRPVLSLFLRVGEGARNFFQWKVSLGHHLRKVAFPLSFVIALWILGLHQSQRSNSPSSCPPTSGWSFSMSCAESFHTLGKTHMGSLISFAPLKATNIQNAETVQRDNDPFLSQPPSCVEITA